MLFSTTYQNVFGKPLLCQYVDRKIQKVYGHPPKYHGGGFGYNTQSRRLRIYTGCVPRGKSSERVENLQLFTAGGDYSWAVTTAGR